jgi:hypothetical protein
VRIHSGNHMGEYKAVERDGKHTPPEGETPHKPRRKNRRKWCGGHPGREHDVRWIPDDRFGWWQGHGVKYFERKCVRCKKVLKTERRMRIGWLSPGGELVEDGLKDWPQLVFYGPGFPPRGKL